HSQMRCRTLGALLLIGGHRRRGPELVVSLTYRPTNRCRRLRLLVAATIIVATGPLKLTHGSTATPSLASGTSSGRESSPRNISNWSSRHSTAHLQRSPQPVVRQAQPVQFIHLNAESFQSPK